jgi:Holliday junction resolvasome RuvABC DNA-binding subunit
VRALVKLGYTPAVADTAVRAALDADITQDTAALVRRALSDLTRKS